MTTKHFLLLFTLLLMTGLPLSLSAQNSNLNGAVQDIDTNSEPQLQTLTLFEAIDYARENSLQARMQEYQLIASRWSYRTYRTELLPELRLQGNAPNFSSAFRDVQLANGEIVQVYTQQSNASANLSISQEIALTGGSVQLQTGLRRFGIFQAENNYEWTSTVASISYTQPINAFNSLKWQNRIEPLALEIAEKEYVEAIESLSQQVTQAYFQVLTAKTNLDISELNVASNDSIYNISQGRFTVGRIAQDELLQSEIQLRNSEIALNQDRLAYEEEIRRFRLLLGMDAEAPVDVVPPDEIPDIEVDANLALEMALANNSEFLGYQLNTLEAERSLDQAIKQSAFSPTVTASFGLSQQSEEFENLYVDPLRDQGFNVAFSLPIFNWGRQRTIINQQRNAYQRTADQIAYQRQQFILDVQSTVNRFRQLPYQLEVAQLSYELAEQRYEVAYGRYGIGSQTLTELQNAQESRESARLNYLQAIGDYWASVFELRELTLYDFQENRLITHDLLILD